MCTQLKVMGYRINERNTGNYSLEGNMKQRRNKKVVLTENEKQLAKAVIMRVYECMEADEDNKHQYIDGGRFIISLSKEQWQSLFDIQEKL